MIYFFLLRKEKKWKDSSISIMKNDFESQNFEIFDQVAHNFGKSDYDMI